MKKLFAPSILCMNFLDMRQQLEVLNARADILHYDIMDGHFVKNLGLGFDFVRAAQSVATTQSDCHLMVTDPERYIDAFAQMGGTYITPHAECIATGAFRVFDTIMAAGCKAGVALNPASSIHAIEPYAHLLDKITIMTIEPGFPGQRFLPEMYEKIAQAKALRERKGYHYLIEIDGSCSDENFAQLCKAGVDVFVVGVAALYGRASDLTTAYEQMEQSFSSFEV